ncbi:hypothetical protein AWJ20_4691 [Sugiyamaella lignohabitans]|uniref:DUF1682 family protein n=1 Tax=Sugiyamaella lignohabitans TaxID=796027 RepID=A0A161HKU1_9ASCO|nr:uncharacterized protein AWJ20_4691 [Sugiyamaella lignohabitans]ANB13747.1 hypothetical protein AWJ20_4691 [Sugiyamaella lignohabitans]
MGPLQRARVYDWSKEFLIVLSIMGYVVLHFLGLRVNQGKVSSWIKAHLDVLQTQFYQVGPKPNITSTKSIDYIVTDGATAYNTYATGRVNVSHVLAKFRLLGRQNFITLSMEYFTSIFLQGFNPRDQIDVVITPSDPAAIDPFVFAVVNKENMSRSRDQNYFLSITRTVDSDKLPPSFTFMTESAEVTDTVVELAKEFFQALETPGVEKVLEYFAITDQQPTAPLSLKDLEPKTKLYLSLKFPSNKEQSELSARILNSAINLVDILVAKKTWRPEVAKKIKATRDAEIKKVQKALDLIKAEELAQKKTEALREKKAALAKLSPEEQKKLDQKSKEKEQRKLRSKQIRR